jgi:hypothetical protein
MWILKLLITTPFARSKNIMHICKITKINLDTSQKFTTQYVSVGLILWGYI